MSGSDGNGGDAAGRPVGSPAEDHSDPDGGKGARPSGPNAAPKEAPAVKTEEGHHHRTIASGERSITEQEFVDRINRSDRWMIGLTAAIAFFGLVSAVIFGWQLHVMQGQLDEMRGEQRARIAADNMILNGPIPSTDVLNLAVLIDNYGRDAAHNVTWALANPTLVPFIPEEGGVYVPIPHTDICTALHHDRRKGVTVFPTPETKKWIPVSLPNSQETKMVVTSAIAEKGSMIVNGCILYRTLRTWYKTSFHYLWRSVKGTPPAAWAFQEVGEGDH